MWSPHLRRLRSESGRLNPSPLIQRNTEIECKSYHRLFLCPVATHPGGKDALNERKKEQNNTDPYQRILTALYESEGMDGINELYLKLTQRLMFNIHEIDDDYDVFVAFETMNNRGKKLTNLELLKNRLIYLTTLYPESKFDKMDKENLRKQINDTWKEVYFQRGRNEKTPLSDDDFLRAHWIVYFAYSRRKGDDYIHFLLNKFSAK